MEKQVFSPVLLTGTRVLNQQPTGNESTYTNQTAEALQQSKS